MTQTDSRVIFPPLLLATDGSSSAQLAQKMIQPLVRLFEQQTRTPSLLLMVLTVQPKVVRRLQRLGKKSPATDAKTKDKVETEPEAVVAEDLSNAGSTALLETLTAAIQADFSASSGVRLEVRQGRPTAEILNCARSIQAGLIAVGHRGTGGVRELLLGSVSTAIARYAPCSVLIARNPSQLSDVPTLNHVLLVVDESVGTRSAIAATRQLIPAGVQTITLLHIQSPLNANYLLGSFFSPTPNWQLNQSLQNVQKEQGMEVLQQATASLNCEESRVTVTTRLQTGDAGPLICQAAQELQADLIVLGNDSTRQTLLSPLQGRRSRQATADSQSATRPMRNTRLSVTDDYVIHYAPCPVLLCRYGQRSQG